jgi:hypothetical protein
MNSCRSDCFTATIESAESSLTNRAPIQNARGWLHDGGGALKTNPCAPVARYWPIASRRSCWCPGTVTPPRRGAACSGRTTLRRQIRHAVSLRWQESLSGSAFWYASQAIPVIAVTSYALSGDEQKARDAGCGASTFATDETCQIPPRAVRIPRWFNCSAIATMPTRPWARMLRITLIAKRPASAC